VREKIRRPQLEIRNKSQGLKARNLKLPAAGEELRPLDLFRISSSCFELLTLMHSIPAPELPFCGAPRNSRSQPALSRQEF
jgi:hypothetical protein